MDTKLFSDSHEVLQMQALPGSSQDNIDPNVSRDMPERMHILREHNRALEKEIIKVKRERQALQAQYDRALIVIGEKKEEMDQLMEDISDLKSTLKEQAMSMTNRFEDTIQAQVETINEIF